MEELESSMQIFVAEFATPYLFVHAGVVEWNGRAIVLPGSSFAGKSTLVTALVNAGATYYSDEYAVFDDEGKVLPYRRRISLREGPLGPAGRVEIGQPTEAASAGDAAIPVGVVLLTRYRYEAPWECARLEQGSAIMALCEHTVAIQRRPVDTFAILGNVVGSASVFRGSRGDLESAVSFLLDVR
ncbi:MAG: hypothetical protein M3457_19575 [Chloroflexota bacterium]|nr:hypothetical protein [Chloroflexota bacterium]